MYAGISLGIALIVRSEYDDHTNTSLKEEVFGVEEDGLGGMSWIRDIGG